MFASFSMKRTEVIILTQTHTQIYKITGGYTDFSFQISGFLSSFFVEHNCLIMEICFFFNPSFGVLTYVASTEKTGFVKFIFCMRFDFRCTQSLFECSLAMQLVDNSNRRT